MKIKQSNRNIILNHRKKIIQNHYKKHRKQYLTICELAILLNVSKQTARIFANKEGIDSIVNKKILRHGFLYDIFKWVQLNSKNTHL